MDIETFGVELYMGDGASPEGFTLVAGVTEIPTLFSFERSTIDTSELKDQVSTFLAGRLDPGNVEFGLKFDPQETTHSDTTGLIKKMLTRGATNWVIKIPDDGAGVTHTWIELTGPMVSLNVGAAGNDVVRGTGTIKISGQPTFGTTKPTGVP